MLYQEEWGSVDPSGEPSDSRWCSAWPNSREGGGVLSYTSGQQAAVVLFEVLRLYQGSMVDCICQVKSRFCLYQVTSKILFIPGHFQDSVYTRSFQDSVYTRSFQDSVYTRWCSFTHTSVRGTASACAADTHQSSDCDSVCVTAFVTRVSWAMTLVGADWYHQSPRL